MLYRNRKELKKVPFHKRCALMEMHRSADRDPDVIAYEKEVRRQRDVANKTSHKRHQRKKATVAILKMRNAL